MAMPSSGKTQAATRPPNDNGGLDGGFTLIELMVVIAILGVLAAVVVFAVRGLGSKGRVEASATERRILQTAEESYCAQHNKYATEQELKDGGYLSGDPGYWDVTAADTSTGQCNGWTYTLSEREPPVGPTTTTTRPKCTSWCDGASTTNLMDSGVGMSEPMVALADGKVLAVTADSQKNQNYVEVFDPAGGSDGKGSWSPPTQPSGGPSGPGYMDEMVLLTRNCASLCGWVLGRQTDRDAQGSNPNGWMLRDTSGFWYPVTAGTTDPEVTSAVELSNGKVLVVQWELGGQQSTSGEQQARLFDPATGFNPTSGTGAFGTDFGTGLYNVSPLVVSLSNGKALVVGDYPDPTAPTVRKKTTKVFDPVNGGFSGAADPSFNYNGRTSTAAVLPSGKVLVVNSNDARAEIYNPSANTWEPSTSCGSFCRIITTMPDGKVLAATSYTATFLFDPSTNLWTPTSPPTPTHNVGFGVLLNSAGCSAHCGEAFVATPFQTPTQFFREPAG